MAEDLNETYRQIDRLEGTDVIGAVHLALKIGDYDRAARAFVSAGFVDAAAEIFFTRGERGRAIQTYLEAAERLDEEGKGGRAEMYRGFARFTEQREPARLPWSA